MNRSVRALVLHLSSDDPPEAIGGPVDVVRSCDGRWSVRPAPSSSEVTGPVGAWAASLVAGVNWVGRTRVTQMDSTTWRLERHRDVSRRRCP